MITYNKLDISYLDRNKKIALVYGDFQKLFPAGNIEYLIWLQKGNDDSMKCSPEIIEAVVSESHIKGK